MPMKPRTFRRVVLLGSLGTIVLLIVFGYFVFRPWQSARKLNAMRTQGIVAYENGDFVEAVTLLGRYNRNAEDADPETLLMHARARAKVQVPDGGHVLAAVNSYREYLRRVPGDREAMRELLPLLNAWQMFVEARTLAEDLINKYDERDIEIYRELRYTLASLQVRDAELEPVLRTIYEHAESNFSDADLYYRFLIQHGRESEVDELLEARLAQFPERTDEQLLAFQRFSEGMSNEDVLNELSRLIGLNPETAEWDPDAPEINSSTAWQCSRIYNELLRPKLSLAVQVRSAKENGDFGSIVWASRRLYWSRDDETLLSLSFQTDSGEPDPDLIGYQILAAQRGGDEVRRDTLLEQLNSVVLDRRASAWLAFLDADEALREERIVDARIAMQRALEGYPAEPTFHLVMGDVQQSQGRFNEAVEEWLLANRLANTEIGREYRFDTMGWSTPLIQIVKAYAEQGRLIEALDYIDELERLGPDGAIVVLQSKAELARRNELPRDSGQRFVENWNLRREEIPAEDRARLTPLVATILSSMGEREEARALLGEAFAVVDPRDPVMVELINVDLRYEYGISAEAGLEYETIGSRTPIGALGIAMQVAIEQGSTDAGLQIIESGLASSDDESRYNWEQVRAQFLDIRNDSRAKDAWDDLVRMNPDDVRLLYLAAESKAYGDDLGRVNELIDRIVELTETAGRTLPARLRLARAGAIVTGVGKHTRTNRNRAMEIVRSVVASEPGNVQARTMLGNLLALQPDPGLPENEQYEPDIQGAVDEYVTLSRQLNNDSAQRFLLQASDLAFKLGDDNQSKSLLREFMARFKDDLAAHPQVAQRFVNLGESDEAISIYRRVLRITGSPQVALSLADTLLAQGQLNSGKELLIETSKAEVLDQRSLLRLASLMARSGNQSEAEDIASNGEHYGLSSGEAHVVFASFARSYLTPEDQIAALREAVEVEPSYSRAWKMLIQRLIELGRREEALSAYQQASSMIDADDELARLGVLAQGTPGNAVDLLSLPGMGDSPRLRQAVELVDAYASLEPGVGIEKRTQMLEELIDLFPTIGPVQTYAVRELSSLPLNPMVLAQVGEKALKNVPGDATVMGITSDAYLRVSQPEHALRVINLWNANTLDSTLTAALLSARAHIQLEDFAKAESFLSPYVDEAMHSADLPASAELLNAYCTAKLRLGEDPQKTHERLAGLISEYRDIRIRVWLGLAVNTIQDAHVGAQWIREAEAVSEEDDQQALGRAWVSLAFNHQAWVPEYAQNALGHLEPLIDGNEDPSLLMGIARAHVILARSSDDSGVSSDHYGIAVSQMLRASRSEPSNIAPLLDAAVFAAEGGMYDQAKSIYQQIVDFNLPPVPLKAMVLNNLAMSYLRAGLDPVDASTVRAFVDEATVIMPEAAPYWGTRGWIELELNDLQAAEQAFKTAIQIDRSNAEGWVGLAIAYHQMGDARSTDLSDAVQRIRELAAQAPLEDELVQMLRQYGVDL
ncbi:MAG: tetratricopeptide repeat protein [Phycisphaerales bacterium JB052]